jgi:hypothetical protein
MSKLRRTALSYGERPVLELRSRVLDHMTPNPSIERTSRIKPREAAHSNVSAKRLCGASACRAAYALNGLSSGTPKDLKSATFLVTTVKP